MSAAECVLEADCELGESPVWSAAEAALYFVDVLGRRVHRFDPATGDRRSWPTPSEVGSIGLRAGGGLVAALQDGFYRLDTADGSARLLARVEEGAPGTRFNDGRVAPGGAFFFAGTKAGDWRTGASGGLWALDETGAVRKVLGDMRIANGLCWSPDGRTMYHADSPTQRIRRHAYDPDTGAVGPGERFAGTDGTDGFPDGATTDAEGGVWSAQFNLGRVVRYAPDGRLDAMILVPVVQATSCALGGPDLRTLYITTAREDYSPERRAAEPLAGALFAARVEVPGVPEPAFRG